jgi:histidinol-phosphate aminotransferase
MSNDFTRRELLKRWGFIVGAGVVAPQLVLAQVSKPTPSSEKNSLIRLSLNENPYGPSPNVAQVLQLEFGRLNRYADAPLARQLAEQIAEYEHVPVEQVVIGEILDLLGLFLGSSGGPGGEFVYSTPGYLALIDAAARLGGVGVPVPLNGQYQNDLVALKSKVNAQTRAIYLINPHNPTGTINDDEAFKSFLRETSRSAVVVVDEAYLEYTSDFVFFDAGRPQPVLAAAMRRQGVDIGRAHPPYTNWARITIGLSSENLRAQNALRAALKET